MKIAIATVGVALFFSGVIAIKTWQYRSCLSDGMSPGTCLGIISR